VKQGTPTDCAHDKIDRGPGSAPQSVVPAGTLGASSEIITLPVVGGIGLRGRFSSGRSLTLALLAPPLAHSARQGAGGSCADAGNPRWTLEVYVHVFFRLWHTARILFSGWSQNAYAGGQIPPLKA